MPPANTNMVRNPMPMPSPTNYSPMAQPPMPSPMLGMMPVPMQPTPRRSPMNVPMSEPKRLKPSSYTRPIQSSEQKMIETLLNPWYELRLAGIEVRMEKKGNR